MCRIGDLCDTISETYKRTDNMVVLINTSDVLEGEVLNHTPVPNENLKGQFKKTFQRDDILYSEIRPANKRFAFIDFEDTSKYIASTKLMVLRPRKAVVLPLFLYAILKSRDVLEELQHLAETRSGTFPQITFSSELAPMEIMLPDFTTQKQIVGILSAIEDKIRLNTAINENLEQQAQAIYQDFLYNNSNDLIATTIGDICDVKGGKRLPKGINLVSSPNSHPYIRVRDLNDSTIISLKNDFEYVDDETQKTISRYIVSTDDIIISIVGTIGLTAIVNESLNNANLTENCVKLTNIKNATPEYILLFLKSEIGQNEIMRGTVGAVQLKLPIKNIQSIKIDLLPLEAMTDLDKVLKPIFHSISANIEENQRLAALRDTLLPKLMNGEIDVSEVKI